ncbi:MAG: aminomethyl-transferring glycine dehydrogenase subunit GcvPB [Actinobacteria bacterium]|nr:aminomethyl-transferring glycine dehydrogenase subunit GcvPB [Actinomycetota bacterium]MCL6104187.1 aminomethyl-transferring glycine dehydrogenase subunit GcvPB [Actinomycetota bacterium]
MKQREVITPAEDDIPKSSGGNGSSAPLLGSLAEPTIFELSKPGRRAFSFRSTNIPEYSLDELVPPQHLPEKQLRLVEVSERDIVAHFTRLSMRQYGVDVGVYPLGSCTMKYNPKVCDTVASLSGLTNMHPASDPKLSQGWLKILLCLEEAICEITGMDSATLQPSAGASAELTGLLIMKAWHSSKTTGFFEKGRGYETRHKVLIPDSSHGTNPASVALSGYDIVTVPSNSKGLIDIEALKSLLGDDIAGIMLTNPNTLGLFEEEIAQIAEMVHEVGGLLYYDGANLNAILGVTRPGDMGFDIVHTNLHKTFATPHGGGGPGAAPLAVTSRLAPFLPGPRPYRLDNGSYGWTTPAQSIGRVHSWHGNALVVARAWAYILLNGPKGLKQVSQAAVLNANWLKKSLQDTYDVPYDNFCMHEFVLSCETLKKAKGLSALDVAKCLLQKGFHPPTIYFPLIVHEALMIEPTETESLETLKELSQALKDIARATPEEFGSAPSTTVVQRVDEVQAARSPLLTWDAVSNAAIGQDTRNA